MVNEEIKGKRILFLGGGAYQLDAILAAKRLSLTTVVMDGAREAPGFRIADVPIHHDFSDVEKAIRIAHDQDIAGVLSICTEVGVVPVARIAQALGLPGIPVDTALAATNKLAMRRRLRDAGLPMPLHAEIANETEAQDWTEMNGFPCIIKPQEGSGSRGVRKVTNQDEIALAFHDASEKSRNGRVLIEEYMRGEEVHVDCITCQGETTVLGVADKVRTPEPYRSDIKVSYPAKISHSLVEEVQRQAVIATDALGIRNGTSHTELLVEGEKARIVEIAARGAGFHVFTKMLKQISGVDPVEAVIRMALGKSPSIVKRPERSAILYFFMPPQGTLIRVQGLEVSREIQGVEDLQILIKPGERIHQYRSGDDRVGYVIVNADTRDEAEEILSDVRKSITFEVQA